jgi:hypothetical protein
MAQRLVILTGFPQALEENVGMFSFTSFPIGYSLILPPFYAIESKLLTASFNKMQISK